MTSTATVIANLQAELAEARQAAEFNFEQYQDAGRLLHEECEKSERLESKLANLQPQSEALHKVASAIGFEAGEDVTMAPIVVRALKSNYDKLEQAHQELLTERDDWRTYAREAGAQKVKTQQDLHEVKRQRDELLAELEWCAKSLNPNNERTKRVFAAIASVKGGAA